MSYHTCIHAHTLSDDGYLPLPISHPLTLEPSHDHNQRALVIHACRSYTHIGMCAYYVLNNNHTDKGTTTTGRLAMVTHTESRSVTMHACHNHVIFFAPRRQCQETTASTTPAAQASLPLGFHPSMTHHYSAILWPTDTPYSEPACISKS